MSLDLSLVIPEYVPSFMPATAQLRPYKLKEPWRKLRWYFWVPAELSDTGKRVRKYFATKIEAEDEAILLKQRRDDFGASLQLLTGGKRVHDASEAYRMLDEWGLDLTLRECVRIAHAEHTKRAKSQTFGQTVDEVLLKKARRSSVYQYAFRRLRNQFAYLADTLLCDIRTADLEKFLSTQSVSNRNFALRHLRVIFLYGIKQNYLTGNPLNGIDIELLAPKETEIVSVPDVERLLVDAWVNDRELVPFLVLGFYAGIRPTGELRRMTWGHINLDAEGEDEHVKLPAGISKTKKFHRWIRLPDNAVAWLREYQLQGGRTSGPIITLSQKPFEEHRRLNRTRAKMVGDWPNSGMRHSFASYWVASQPNAEKSLGRLMQMLGHTELGTLHNHYYQTVSKREAERFYAIWPPSDTRKIIPYPAAS
jgi:integrase